MVVFGNTIDGLSAWQDDLTDESSMLPCTWIPRHGPNIMCT